MSKTKIIFIECVVCGHDNNIDQKTGLCEMCEVDLYTNGSKILDETEEFTNEHN